MWVAEPDEVGQGAAAGSAGQAAAADWGRASEQALGGRPGKLRGHYQRQLAVAVLSLLYGTGLRRGELERLNLEDWKREENRAEDRRAQERLRAERAAGRRDRPVPGSVRAAIGRTSWKRRGTHGEEALLINRAGQAAERAEPGAAGAPAGAAGAGAAGESASVSSHLRLGPAGERGQPAGGAAACWGTRAWRPPRAICTWPIRSGRGP